MCSRGDKTDSQETHERSGPGDELRFRTPLYTVSEAARYLALPRQTLTYWADPHGNRKPVVTTVGDRHRNQPVVPFIGFTEAFVASVFRRVHGLSWPYIRKALARIEDGIGLEHALASEKLYTDGAKIVFDYGKQEEEVRLLVEVVSDNVVFTEVIEDYLKRIDYAPDGWAEQIILPTPRPIAAVTPYKAYGQPLTLKGDARVVDVLDRFAGDESSSAIAEDFGVPAQDVEDIIRAFYKAA